MKKEIKFEISIADKELFSNMQRNFASVAEKAFFKKMCYKEQYEPAFSNELLVFENENESGIFLLRKYYDTYLIGYRNPIGTVAEYECVTLCAALSSRLDQCIGFPLQITLLEWLRKFDYGMVKYNRNYDED